MPETIEGRLACRIALGVDVAAQLLQQLEQQLRPARVRPVKAADADIAG